MTTAWVRAGILMMGGASTTNWRVYRASDGIEVETVLSRSRLFETPGLKDFRIYVIAASMMPHLAL